MEEWVLAERVAKRVQVGIRELWCGVWCVVCGVWCVVCGVGVGCDGGSKAASNMMAGCLWQSGCRQGAVESSGSAWNAK